MVSGQTALISIAVATIGYGLVRHAPIAIDAGVGVIGMCVGRWQAYAHTKAARRPTPDEYRIVAQKIKGYASTIQQSTRCRELHTALRNASVTLQPVKRHVSGNFVERIDSLFTSENSSADRLRGPALSVLADISRALEEAADSMTKPVAPADYTVRKVAALEERCNRLTEEKRALQKRLEEGMALHYVAEQRFERTIEEQAKGLDSAKAEEDKLTGLMRQQQQECTELRSELRSHVAKLAEVEKLAARMEEERNGLHAELLSTHAKLKKATAATKTGSQSVEHHSPEKALADLVSQRKNLPGDLGQLVDRLAELAKHRRDLAWLCQHLDLLDNTVYGHAPVGAPSNGAVAISARRMGQIGHVISWLDAEIDGGGLSVIEPQRDSVYDALLHEFDEGDCARVTDPAQENKVLTVLQVGYRTPHAVLRKARVRKTVYSQSPVAAKPAPEGAVAPAAELEWLSKLDVERTSTR